MRQVLLIVAFACAAFGQAAESLTFDVASVKVSPPLQPNERIIRRGGPGTSDPGQITYSYATLKTLLTLAYDVKDYQVNGPSWLDTEHYDIAAKVPEGATPGGVTKEQVNAMWQNLLKERFGLVAHHESKEFQVDELVPVKGGSKLKETSLDPKAPAATESGPRKLDKNGAPEMNGPGMMLEVEIPQSGAAVGHLVGRAQTLSQLATTLGNQLHHPVVDKTGLTGKYDFNLEFAPDLSRVQGLPSVAGPGGTDAAEPGSNLASAIQQQLGLRLAPGKAKLDVIVVDKAEKVPTEN